MKRTAVAFALALAGRLVSRAEALDVSSGPVEVSRPNAVGSCNTGFVVFGTWNLDDAEEPSVAVNPVNPDNIVASWIQGPFQDNVTAVSFDGAQTWQRVAIPLTTCSPSRRTATCMPSRSRRMRPRPTCGSW